MSTEPTSTPLSGRTALVARSADGDGRSPGPAVGERRLAHRLLDQRLHDLRLGHGLDDLAPDEDLALAVAGGDTQVGLPGLAGPVHDAAHHRDPQGHLQALEA